MKDCPYCGYPLERGEYLGDDEVSGMVCMSEECDNNEVYTED